MRQALLFCMAVSIGGCFPFIPAGGGGGGSGSRGGGGAASRDDEEKEAPPIPPTKREDLVAKLNRRKLQMARIQRDFATPSDIYHTRGEIHRVDPKSSAHAFGVGRISGAFSMLAFAGTQDDKLCFVYDEEIGVTVGEKKHRSEVYGRMRLFPFVLYAVDDLSKLTGVAWPAPDGATTFDLVEIVEVDVDVSDHRVAIVKVCAPKPALTSTTRFLVAQQHDRKTHPPLVDVSAEPIEARDLMEETTDTVFVWKLE